jgi:hypothetical protein
MPYIYLRWPVDLNSGGSSAQIGPEVVGGAQQCILKLCARRIFFFEYKSDGIIFVTYYVFLYFVDQFYKSIFFSKYVIVL